MSFELHGNSDPKGSSPRPKNEGRYGLAMVTSFNWDMRLGHPVVTLTAGCGSILDRKLENRKLPFDRLEAGIPSRRAILCAGKPRHLPQHNKQSASTVVDPAKQSTLQ